MAELAHMTDRHHHAHSVVDLLLIGLTCDLGCVDFLWFDYGSSGAWFCRTQLQTTLWHYGKERWLSSACAGRWQKHEGRQDCKRSDTERGSEGVQERLEGSLFEAQDTWEDLALVSDPGFLKLVYCVVETNGEPSFFYKLLQFVAFPCYFQ